MKPTLFLSAAASLIALLCSTAQALEYRLVYKTVYDEEEVQAYKIEHETVYEERRVTSYRPVTETETRERRYTVAHPVTETAEREERYTVRRPVVETQEREDRYMVRRPVIETQERDEVSTMVEQQTTYIPQVIDQGGYVDQQYVQQSPGRTRLRWVQGGSYVDPGSGTVVYRRSGLGWVAEPGPAVVQTQRMYQPNYVTAQVPVTQYVPHQVTRKVPVQVTRYVDEEVVQRVPVQVTRMVEEERVRKVPVISTHTEYEERVEPVQVTVHRLVPVEETIRVPKTVERRVPVTYTRKVPRTVVMKELIDPCGLVTSAAYLESEPVQSVYESSGTSRKTYADEAADDLQSSGGSQSRKAKKPVTNKSDKTPHPVDDEDGDANASSHRSSASRAHRA